jgi:hypothetical protein
MNAISSQTCIRFVPRTFQPDFVNIVLGPGCSSFVGRTGGIQNLYLAIPGCMHEPLIVHELLHAVGLHHMHQYEGRNSFIKVHYKNIVRARRSNFNTVSLQWSSLFNTPYDYYRYASIVIVSIYLLQVRFETLIRHTACWDPNKLCVFRSKVSNQAHIKYLNSSR